MKGETQRVISAQHYKEIFEKCHICRHDEPSLKCFSLFVFSLSLFAPPWTSPRNVDLPSMQAKGAGGKTVATQGGGPDQKAICKTRKAKKKSNTSNDVRELISSELFQSCWLCCRLKVLSLITVCYLSCVNVLFDDLLWFLSFATLTVFNALRAYVGFHTLSPKRFKISMAAAVYF